MYTGDRENRPERLHRYLRHIRSKNPYRYSSYYYDTEIGLYYLQSRYYDPVVGRFICGDDVIYALMPYSVIQYNCFVYCQNSPVMMYDPAGTDAIWLQDTDGVGGMGHTGVLLQDKNGVWHYFSWSMDESKPFIIKASGKKFEKYDKDTDLSRYERYIYFKGDFSESEKIATVLSESKCVRYDLMKRNCVQIVIWLLCFGKFSKNDLLYKVFLKTLAGTVIPNNIFYSLLGFHKFLTAQ